MRRMILEYAVVLAFCALLFIIGGQVLYYGWQWLFQLPVH